jgi:hypothetical protein
LPIKAAFSFNRTSFCIVGKKLQKDFKRRKNEFDSFVIWKALLFDKKMQVFMNIARNGKTRQN